MENRFRNFLTSRRSRAIEVDPPLETQGSPYNSSPDTPQPPTLSFKFLNKSQADLERPGSNAMPLRSFSYESCQAGKTPTFGELPQKGNGPIKLQTSRRMSSGELIVVPQDSQRILEDIREDGYIVGKKTSQNSPKQVQHSQTVPRPRLSQTSHSAPSLQAPFSRDTWSRSAKTSEEDLHVSNQRVSSTFQQPVGLGVFQPSSPERSSRKYESISEFPTYLRTSSVSAASIALSTKPPAEFNATLKALRKAEYQKLVELYGSDVTARNLAYYNAANSDPSLQPPPIFSPVILEPLPLPPVETEPRRLSQSSTTSESLHSGSSSPLRASYVSSVATGQTSIEEDSASTREDIRRMVEQMRHSYLSAIESRDPVHPKPKSRKPRKNRQSSASSNVTNAGQRRSSTAPASLSSRTYERQTWHPADAERDTRNERRINSHPPSGFGRLSPIEASPPRKADIETGLRRADSGTLGKLMAETTRDQIRSRSSTLSRVTSNEHEAEVKLTTPTKPPHTSQSWLDLDSKSNTGAEVESPIDIDAQPVPFTLRGPHSRKDSEDFDELFSSDLWRLSTQEPAFRPLSLCKTYSSESYPTTPRKKISYITAIPESPEYTHLATTSDPDNNFI